MPVARLLLQFMPNAWILLGKQYLVDLDSTYLIRHYSPRQEAAFHGIPLRATRPRLQIQYIYEGPQRSIPVFFQPRAIRHTTGTNPTPGFLNPRTLNQPPPCHFCNVLDHITYHILPRSRAT